MSLSARQPNEAQDSPAGLARRGVPLPAGGAIHLRAAKGEGSGLKLVDGAGASTAGGAGEAGGAGGVGRRKDGAVLRGLRDLRQLQKQTIAVLEAVRGNLEDIQQVLRSPEATRGMEKQQNAAALLAKGFAREAVAQAEGAVELLPANPDAHLLLSLSLAADQQFEPSLGAARKGLALFDRRQHPLAIEAGLLHAIAALGCGAEAAERWGQIIDGLPLAVLLEHLGRIAVCYPGDAPEGQLDGVVEARIVRRGGPSEAAARRGRRGRLAGDEVPAGTLLAGLDAAYGNGLRRTRDAILVYLKQKAMGLGDPAEAVRFIGEFVVPLGNRGMERPACSLAKRCGLRLLQMHADAMTLYRAMTRLEMAGCATAAGDIALILNHWRKASARQARAGRLLGLAGLLMAAGAGVLGYVLWGRGGLGAIGGKAVAAGWWGVTVNAIWIGPGMVAAGAVLGVAGLMGRYPEVELRGGRGSLSREERAFLGGGEARVGIRSALRGK